MARIADRTWDALFVLTAAPFAADTVTTTLRLVDAMLRRRATVAVWACGYATALTAAALGEHKPADLTDHGRSHPSTAALVGALLTAHDGRLDWWACRFCSEDRGVLRHRDGVRVRPYSAFARVLPSARHVIYLGGA